MIIFYCFYLIHVLAEMITRIALCVEQSVNEILQFFHFCQKYTEVHACTVGPKGGLMDFAGSG